jgi:drug/metabolite transporter (DMT)-like permease
VGSGIRLGLVWYLVHKPLWLLGFLAAGAALGFHALALGGAQLGVVQPILVSSLLFALPVSALIEHGRPSAREWAWAALLVVGLGAFLSLARPSGGTSDPPLGPFLLTLLGAGVLGAVAVFVGTQVLQHHRVSFLGLASGVAYGMVAPLIKDVIALAGNQPIRLVTTWPAYALVLIGACAVVLNQSAYQAGPLAASLPPLTLADPIVATFIGVVAFGDRLDTAPVNLIGEILSVVAISLAVRQLARQSSRVGAEQAPTPSQEQMEYRN